MQLHHTPVQCPSTPACTCKCHRVVRPPASQSHHGNQIFLPLRAHHKVAPKVVMAGGREAHTVCHLHACSGTRSASLSISRCPWSSLLLLTRCELACCAAESSARAEREPVPSQNAVMTLQMGLPEATLLASSLLHPLTRFTITSSVGGCSTLTLRATYDAGPYWSSWHATTRGTDTVCPISNSRCDCTAFGKPEGTQLSAASEVRGRHVAPASAGSGRAARQGRRAQQPPCDCADIPWELAGAPPCHCCAGTTPPHEC